MHEKPIILHPDYKAANKLNDKVIVITGGDSGIGKAVAYHCAAEGAKIVYVYLNEHKDAEEVNSYLNKQGCEFLSLAADLSVKENCHKVIKSTIDKFKTINCLVNNLAQQYPVNDIKEITPEQLELTFKTNVFSYFYMSQLALEHMQKNDNIINTTSVTAYRGSSHLIDYSSTKGAIVSFTRSLAKSLMKTGIRVNGVAPGPVWTPLIPASFDEDIVEGFGEGSPMGAPAQPADIAPAYIYLACNESRFMSGQILHPNSGEIVNG
jgi:NAD(P)-dependent dehydrogenase (short-subunit alcohol dehydrogenase family)